MKWPCGRASDRAVGKPVPKVEDDRSPMARAAAWASRILTVALEMVLPGLLGYWLDRWLRCEPLLTLLGFGFGGTAAFIHLLAMTRHFAESDRDRPGKKDD